ncbi:MAG: zf-TFIIB domain-containing protein [Alphaproteobacteria bacterium]|nr:zf-TFIIB domain-containing protein [Alphaproteobacteria bacterium]
MPLLMCPNCNVAMQDVARKDVQIDICPQCRGVWLDRGELEKLLGSIRHTAENWEREREREHPGRDRDREWRDRDAPYAPHRKRKSMFDNVLDIFD